MNNEDRLSVPRLGGMVYDYRKSGLRFRLYPDGNITVSSKDLPERSLYQLDQDDFGITHKEFNSICLDGIWEGDVDDVLEAQARISSERGMKRNAGVELYEALKAMVDRYAPSYHDCTDDGMPECEICEARAALAKARGES